MEKIIFGGVCATALFVSAAVSVVSCSGDEEYYKNGNYTLANKRVTRSEEFHYPHEGYPAAAGAKTFYGQYRWLSCRCRCFLGQRFYRNEVTKKFSWCGNSFLP